LVDGSSPFKASEAVPLAKVLLTGDELSVVNGSCHDPHGDKNPRPPLTTGAASKSSKATRQYSRWEPKRHEEDDDGKETSLGRTEKHADDMEARWIPNEGGRCGDDAPRNENTGSPPSCAELGKNNVAGKFE
jgi:hypothetical protein